MLEESHLTALGLRWSLQAITKKRELQTSEGHWCIQGTFTSCPSLCCLSILAATVKSSSFLQSGRRTAPCCFRGFKTMSSPHLQESRGFPQLSVGRKGDVSYYEEEEEELKGFLFLVSSHMQPCPCSGVHQPGTSLQKERLRPASSDFSTPVPAISISQRL